MNTEPSLALLQLTALQVIFYASKCIKKESDHFSAAFTAANS